MWPWGEIVLRIGAFLGFPVGMGAGESRLCDALVLDGILARGGRPATTRKPGKLRNCVNLSPREHTYVDGEVSLGRCIRADQMRQTGTGRGRRRCDDGFAIPA